MTIKTDVLAAQDYISKALISALEKKRPTTASKLFRVYEDLGNLAKQFPDPIPESAFSAPYMESSEFFVNAAEPVDYGYGFGMGEDHITFGNVSDMISLG